MISAVKRQRLRSLFGLAAVAFHWTTDFAVPSTIESIESNGLIARILERFKVNPEEKLGKL